MNDFYIHLTFRGIAVFLIFYLLNYLRETFHFRRKTQFYWYLLGISQTCFLFFPFLKETFAFSYLLIPFKALLLGFSFFLWVASKVFLDEKFLPGKIHFMIFVLVEILGLPVNRIGNKIIFFNGDLVPDRIAIFFVAGTFIMQVLLSGLSLYNIYKSCRSDLDDSFLLVKRFFLISASASEIVILFVLIFHWQNDSEVRMWFVSIFNFTFLFVSFLLLKTGFIEKESQEKIVLKESEIMLLNAKLMQFIKNDQYLFHSDCSLKDISLRVGVPEYKLRKFINEKLSFHNFNQFINYYRIEEACSFFSSNKYKDMPIYRVALTVGFNSVTTFNRAFKEFKKISPTQYRKEIN